MENREQEIRQDREDLIEGRNAVTEALRAAAQPGDLIITVGAGDIYKAGEKLLREN